MATRTALLAVAFAVPVLAAAAPAEDFAYVREAASIDPDVVPIDTRSPDRCRQRSLAGARCLPAADFLGPHRSLASWRDLLWLLATAGLRGSETVLVAGSSAAERDFVAGLLYLSGQQRVRVLAEPIERALARGLAASPGEPRAFARRLVYEAPMRDALIVLQPELRAANPAPQLLDGRSADEYWGATVRATRGGHLPGAQSLPASTLRAAIGGQDTPLPSGSPVAYGHDGFEGLAYFTLLRAGLGVDARIYPGGWAEWAADGSLPADAVTHPDAAKLPAPASQPPPREDAGLAPWLAAVAGSFAALAFALLFARRKAA